MRILFVAGYLPAPPTFGAGRRLYGLMTSLAQSHSVSLIALVEAGADRREQFSATAAFCNELRVIENDRASVVLAQRRGAKLRSVLSRQSYERTTYRRPALQSALDDLLSRERFDTISVESVHLGEYRTPEEIPVVLDAHNIEYEVLTRTAANAGNVVRRAYSLVDSWKLRREEERLWRDVGGCAVPSHREEAVVRAAAPDTLTAVVPNGVDTAFFAPRRPQGMKGSILFFGALDYHPNVDALSFFTEQVMPRLRERHERPRLTIVGRGSSPAIRGLEGPDVHVAGQVDDVREAIDDAAVVVAPLRFGGGTRLKILEAMAMARPVVSTTLGAEGIAAHHGEHLLIADESTAFADAVGRLLDDSALRRSIGEAGRRLVEQRYEWRQSAGQLERLHRAVIASGARRR